MNLAKLKFIFVRFVGVLSMPFFLYLLNYFGFSEETSQLINLLVTAAFLICLYNNDCYAIYYKTKFTANEPVNAYINFKLLKEYVFLYFNHALLSSLIVFIGYSIYSKSVLESGLLVLYIGIEKILDEIQRFNIFNHDYSKWTKLFVIKSFLILFLAIVTRIITGYEILYVYLFTYFLVTGSLIFIHLQSIKRFFSKLKIVFKPVSYLIEYKNSLYKLHILNFLSGNVLIIDKLLITHSQPNNIVNSYYFITQIANSLNLSIDNLYFVHFRKYYINISLSIRNLYPLKFLILLTLFSSFIIGGSVIVSLLYKKIDFFLISLVIIFYAFYNLSQPLFQKLYWFVDRSQLILVELFYYIFAVSAGYLLVTLKINLTGFLFLLIVGMVSRIIFLFFLNRNKC